MQEVREMLAIKNIVAENQCNLIFSDEFFTNNECLCKSTWFILDCV